MLRYWTAGESHGQFLVGIIEGLPAGLEVSEDFINQYLRRRQKVPGRSVRSHRIERDKIQILSGVSEGKTTGSPMALLLPNRARDEMLEGVKLGTIPRPGHADYPGYVKYGLSALTPVAERASARETAMRTALGAIAIQFLKVFQIQVIGFLRSAGSLSISSVPEEPKELLEKRDASPFYCPDPDMTGKMKALLKKVSAAGTTLGGCFEVRAYQVPPGLGSCAQWDKRLDARLSFALMSIPSVKAVEIGEGIEISRRFGRDAIDPIILSGGGKNPPSPFTFVDRGRKIAITRPTNYAGGIEGGISNGLPIVVRGYVKPVPTQKKPLPSVDFRTGKPAPAPYIRSDIFIVPSASVVGEAVIALVLADAILEKFGGDHIQDSLQAYRSYFGLVK